MIDPIHGNQYIIVYRPHHPEDFNVHVDELVNLMLSV